MFFVVVFFWGVGLFVNVGFVFSMSIKVVCNKYASCDSVQNDKDYYIILRHC